jgi:hypothetical protein
MRRVVGCAVLLAGVEAWAAPSATTVSAEGGVEADSNVQRVDTGPGLDTHAVAAAVMRIGARLDHSAKLWGGAYVLAVAALSRVVGPELESGSAVGRDALAVENVTFFSGDLRWVHPVGERSISTGIGLTFADAVPLSDAIGSRTFRTLGADGLLVMRGGGDPSEPRAMLTLAAGGRSFTYKPDHAFDWYGPSASARLDVTLWQHPDRIRSLELVAILGAEARSYNSNALASACPKGAPPDPSCSAGTSIPRRDRYQRAGVELTWTGSFVAAAGYQATLVDSNSYGQSVVRHRATLSATKDLPWQLYGTALATLQLDQYLDGLVVAKDLQNQTFSSIEDENRSSLQLRLARAVTAAWSVESRAAIWRDFGDDMTSFRRELFYVGAIYNH